MHELPRDSEAPEQRHTSKAMKLSAIVSRLQGIMYAEGLTASELVHCARIVRHNHASFSAMSGEKCQPSNQGKGNGEELYCSFCGKSQYAVEKLIAGPRVFICDKCVELCEDIIYEASQK